MEYIMNSIDLFQNVSLYESGNTSPRYFTQLLSPFYCHLTLFLFFFSPTIVAIIRWTLMFLYPSFQSAILSLWTQLFLHGDSTIDAFYFIYFLYICKLNSNTDILPFRFNEIFMLLYIYLLICFIRSSIDEEQKKKKK